MSTALREALVTGRFCYVVELVASALKREAQVLEVASELAGLPDVWPAALPATLAARSATTRSGLAPQREHADWRPTFISPA